MGDVVFYPTAECTSKLLRVLFLKYGRILEPVQNFIFDEICLEFFNLFRNQSAEAHLMNASCFILRNLNNLFTEKQKEVIFLTIFHTLSGNTSSTIEDDVVANCLDLLLTFEDFLLILFDKYTEYTQCLLDFSRKYLDDLSAASVPILKILKIIYGSRDFSYFSFEDLCLFIVPFLNHELFTVREQAKCSLSAIAFNAVRQRVFLSDSKTIESLTNSISKILTSLLPSVLLEFLFDQSISSDLFADQCTPEYVIRDFSFLNEILDLFKIIGSRIDVHNSDEGSQLLKSLFLSECYPKLCEYSSAFSHALITGNFFVTLLSSLIQSCSDTFLSIFTHMYSKNSYNSTIYALIFLCFANSHLQDSADNGIQLKSFLQQELSKSHVELISPEIQESLKNIASRVLDLEDTMKIKNVNFESTVSDVNNFIAKGTELLNFLTSSDDAEIVQKPLF
ncbi:hypothetical protein GEMRC1_002516 [Eukaryota sp. GEM-RC1]